MEMEKGKTTQRDSKGKFIKGHKLASGKLNGMWKGDNVGYYGIHDWLNFYFHKDKCEFCNSKNNLQWANKDGKYRRIREDYFILCSKCHKKYDWNKSIKFLMNRNKNGRFMRKLNQIGGIKNG